MNQELMENTLSILELTLQMLKMVILKNLELILIQELMLPIPIQALMKMVKILILMLELVVI